MALISISTTARDIEVGGARGAVPITTNKGVVEVELQFAGVRLVVNNPFITAHDAVRFSTHIGGLSLGDSARNVSVPFTMVQGGEAAVKVLAGAIHNGDVGSAGRHFVSIDGDNML